MGCLSDFPKEVAFSDLAGEGASSHKPLVTVGRAMVTVRTGPNPLGRYAHSTLGLLLRGSPIPSFPHKALPSRTAPQES